MSRCIQHMTGDVKPGNITVLEIVESIVSAPQFHQRSKVS